MNKLAHLLITALLILFSIPIVSFAQLEYTARIEFKTSSSAEEEFDVLPLSKDGLLVTHRKDEFFGPEKWTFSRYDSTLKERWKIEHKLENEAKPIRSFHNQNYLFWLFKDSDRSEKFIILRIDLAHGDIDTFKGNLLSEVDISHFRVLGNTALIGGYFDSKPVVMTFSFFDKTIKTLPYLFLNHTEINNLEIDEARNEIIVVLYSLHKRKCQLTLKHYSYDGKLLRILNPTFEQDNGLISGKIISLSDNNSLLVGNYSDGCTQYSQGIYFSRIQDTNLDTIQWVDFSQFENFFNYLNPKRKQRIVSRINKQKQSGKEPKFRYKLVVHDIIETPTEYIFTAEIYYPAYTSNTVPMMNSARRTAESQSYHYTHAFVCGFDKNTGKLNWDNCIGLEDVETRKPIEITQITQQEGRLILAYPSKGKIKTEVIEQNRVLREIEAFEIKTPVATEKVTDNEDEQLAAWYDNNFLLFGYQKVTEEKNSGDKREVFSISKVKYDTNAPAKEKKVSK